MTDEGSDIVGMGAIAKSAELLIQRVFNAVGVVYEPHRIRKLAKAKSDAAITAAESEIKITDLHRRAAAGWLKEIVQDQSNMETVLCHAIPLVSVDADPQLLTTDWIRAFFERVKKISDPYVASLWANILASEANRPGHFSIKTVRLMADFDRRDAEDFMNLCRFRCDVAGSRTVLVFRPEDEIYREHGVDEDSLYKLEELGVIRVDHGLFRAGFSTHFAEGAVMEYYGRRARLCAREDGRKIITTGQVEFTRAGRELSTLCEAGPVDSFWSYLRSRWKTQIDAEV